MMRLINQLHKENYFKMLVGLASVDEFKGMWALMPRLVGNA